MTVFSRKKRGSKRRWIFRPLFFLFVWGLLALLLVINGAYEAKRLSDNLHRMLFDQGAAIIAGVEKSAQGIFSSWAAMEAFPEASALLVPSSWNPLALDDAVVDLALETAFQIDQELGNSETRESDFSRIGKKRHLSALKLITSSQTFFFQNPKARFPLEEDFSLPLLEGKSSYAIRRSEDKTTGQMDTLSLAIKRKAGDGTLILHVEDPEIRVLRRRVVLQGLLEEWKERGDVRYLTFQGENLEVWADTSQSKAGNQEEDPFLLKLLVKNDREAQSRLRTDQNILEVGKVVHLDPSTIALIRVGLSTDRVDQIMEGDLRNIVLFSLLLLAFGGAGLALVSRMESRHLARVGEMEEKVRRSERMSSLANLAAGVAHEIRNPLNAISMAIQRLQREFAPSPPEVREEYLHFTEVLRGEVQRLNRIIEQFLYFARPAELNRVPMEIHHVLKDIVLLCREAAEQQKITLVENICPDLPLLSLDRQRMHEALWNLVTNALQAMPRGGVLEIGARANREKSLVTVQISDTGEGIPAENLGRIFDYYFTTKERGTGLGLPLAHKIVQEHGGSIEVQSSVGRGTSFRVSLPVRGEET